MTDQATQSGNGTLIVAMESTFAARDRAEKADRRAKWRRLMQLMLDGDPATAVPAIELVENLRIDRPRLRIIFDALTSASELHNVIQRGADSRSAYRIAKEKDQSLRELIKLDLQNVVDEQRQLTVTLASGAIARDDYDRRNAQLAEQKLQLNNQAHASMRGVLPFSEAANRVSDAERQLEALRSTYPWLDGVTDPDWL